MCRFYGPFLEIKGELVLTSFQTFYVQLKEIIDVKQTNYDCETDEKGFEKRQNINH